MKAARELGSERRETVRSLSVVGVGRLRMSSPVREDRDGCTPGVPVGAEHRWVATSRRDKR